MGAIATGGVRVLNEDVVSHLRVPDEVIDAVAADELRELERRERAYRGTRPVPDVLGKTVILVTHDVREALLLGDRIALMHAGEIVLLETPEGFVKSTNELARAYLETVRDISK